MGFNLPSVVNEQRENRAFSQTLMNTLAQNAIANQARADRAAQQGHEIKLNAFKMILNDKYKTAELDLAEKRLESQERIANARIQTSKDLQKDRDNNVMIDNRRQGHTAMVSALNGRRAFVKDEMERALLGVVNPAERRRIRGAYDPLFKQIGSALDTVYGELSNDIRSGVGSEFQLDVDGPAPTGGRDPELGGPDQALLPGGDGGDQPRQGESLVDPISERDQFLEDAKIFTGANTDRRARVVDPHRDLRELDSTSRQIGVLQGEDKVVAENEVNEARAALPVTKALRAKAEKVLRSEHGAGMSDTIKKLVAGTFTEGDFVAWEGEIERLNRKIEEDGDAQGLTPSAEFKLKKSKLELDVITETFNESIAKFVREQNLPLDVVSLSRWAVTGKDDLKPKISYVDENGQRKTVPTTDTNADVYRKMIDLARNIRFLETVNETAPSVGKSQAEVPASAPGSLEAFKQANPGLLNGQSGRTTQ